MREAEHGESKANLIRKNGIVQKAANETIYWLEQLNASGLLENKAFDELHFKVTELLKLLTNIILSAKKFIINLMHDKSFINIRNGL